MNAHARANDHWRVAVLASRNGSSAVKSNGIVGDKDKSLELALAQIEKQYGRGAIMRMSESTVDQTIGAVPTGSIALDLALGIGGLPDSGDFWGGVGGKVDSRTGDNR